MLFFYYVRGHLSIANPLFWPSSPFFSKSKQKAYTFLMVSQ